MRRLTYYHLTGSDPGPPADAPRVWRTGAPSHRRRQGDRDLSRRVSTLELGLSEQPEAYPPAAVRRTKSCPLNQQEPPGVCNQSRQMKELLLCLIDPGI